MKRTGEIITLNAIALPSAANAFAQSAAQTGLSPSSNDALLLIGAQVEWGNGLASNCSRAVALVRGSKTSMPTILDDDVIAKFSERTYFVTSGMTMQNDTLAMPLPPSAAIVVESNVYLATKSEASASIISATALIYFERVQLTDAEKNAILASRLNNLLT